MPSRFTPFVSGIFIYFFLSAGYSNAQLLDTVKYSLRQKPKFYATLASFNTFIDKQYANIFRVRAGVTYNQRVRFGLGYSNLSNNSVVTELHIVENGLDYYTNGKLNFVFFSVNADYFFFDRYPWQMAVTPFQLGTGWANYEYINRPDQVETLTETEFLVLYQPELSVQYSVFKWIGLGFTLGYRFSLYRSNKVIQDFNAPTIAIDIRLFLDEIYKELTKKPADTE
jgi:hypothetical protein